MGKQLYDAAIHNDAVRKRFMSHVQVTDACWLWTAHRDKDGYGRFNADGLMRMAHRVSYNMFQGSIPDGYELDHLCCTKACVNPAHLEPVTHLQNMQRYLYKSRRPAPRKSHCRRGHLYDVQNTYYLGTMRFCRTCNRINQQAVKERRAKLMEMSQ